MPQCCKNRRAVGDDHVRRWRYQFRHVFIDEVRITGRKTIIDPDILRLEPS
jgi:hypothetical protein